MKTLDVRFTDTIHSNINNSAIIYGTNKSDLARAAMILGLKALHAGAAQSGNVSVKGWIAALNGKVK